MVHISMMIPLMLDIEVAKKNGIIIGIIYFFIYLLTSTASMFSSKVWSRNKSHISTITLFSGFVFGISCGILFFYELWILAIIAFIGIYVVENLRKPILTGFVADQVPNEILTSVLSAQSLLRTIITALLALAFGFIADQFGIGVSFILVSSFLILSTILINFYSRQKS